jgi:DnaJ domain
VSADPFAVLGVAPGASGEEVAAAYRRLAKRWHPDRAGGEDAARRMAEINAAYDLVRSERWLERSGRTAPPAERPAAPSAPRAQAGWWLSAPLRRSAVLRVRTTGGRRLSFAELRPATAAAIARRVAAAT